MSDKNMQVRFIVNDQIITINPTDNFTRNKWLEEPEYAVTRITRFVERGRINLAGETITSIILINDDSEHISLYEALVETESDNESHQVIYDEPNNNNNNTTSSMTYATQTRNETRENVETESNLASESQRSQVGDEWGTEDTKFILDKYVEYMPKIGPMKTFKNKKAMWHRISIDFTKNFKSLRTPGQIENRYKTVLRRKKNAVNHNSKSGNSRQEIPFESELSRIAAIDDSVEPELLQTSKKVKIFKRAHRRGHESDADHDSDISEDCSNQKQKLSNQCKAKQSRKRNLSSLELTLQKLHDERQKAKQERHVEKMNLLKKIFGGKNNSSDESA